MKKDLAPGQKRVFVEIEITENIGAQSGLLGAGGGGAREGDTDAINK